jgi:hypothetical protein
VKLKYFGEVGESWGIGGGGAPQPFPTLLPCSIRELTAEIGEILKEASAISPFSDGH